MPNTKSAIRRVRRVKKQTQINRIRKSKYKNAVKQMELLLKSEEKYVFMGCFFVTKISIYFQIAAVKSFLFARHYCLSKQLCILAFHRFLRDNLHKV